MRIDVLDKGYVDLVDKLGSDLTVVNAARVSFNSQVEELDTKDHKLMNYLASHGHWSPFRHSYLQLRFKAPIFVARQLHTHMVGMEVDFDIEGKMYFSGGYKDIARNEVSGRYVVFEDEFYYPKDWRQQSTSNKQGSAGNLGEPIESELRQLYAEGVAADIKRYQYFISLGVAKEQARIMLPTSLYTQWFWTMSLQAAFHLIGLRAKPDAQLEAQQYGFAVREIVMQKFPVAYEAWSKSGK